MEELVAAAPEIKNWKITALKQTSAINKYSITIGEYKFDETTMSFYSIENSSTPDEIHIAITHKDLTEENKSKITNGIYLAIDNSLGELNSITIIDNVDVIHPSEAAKELVSLKKLKDFLIWREKEFIEKYEGIRRDTENDSYALLEGAVEKELPLIALINTGLLNWDTKASHPWIVVVKIQYHGIANNGIPDKATSQLLNEVEDQMMASLKDVDGYLNIGRQTADSVRSIYFACREFRKPSKILYHLIKSNTVSQLAIEFDIYKDKYWQSFEQFRTPI